MLSHVLRKVRLTGGWAARPTTVRAGCHVWHILPAGEKLFGPDGPDLDGWLRDGLAEIIKHGAQRTVYRVGLPAGGVFVKRCRVNGIRAWWRELFRPAKARLEFENAVSLRSLGLPAVEPLAWASRHPHRPSESLFVTRCQTGAGPLQRFLDETFSAPPAAATNRLRQQIAAELGVLIARLHDAGVAHPDPHPGNLLVQIVPGKAPKFTLIDLHAIRFGRPLPWRDSLNNLVLLNRWFQLRATRADRVRFWRAYVTHRTTLPTACPLALARMAKAVERRTERSNARFWVGRFNRYRKCSRHVHCIRTPHTRGFGVLELSMKFLDRLAADPDAPFRDPAAVVLKKSPGSTVVELMVPTPDGPRAAIYKRFQVKTPLIPWKNLLRPSAAIRSWIFGHNLLDRSLPTARPLCMLHRLRRGFLPAEGYLLAEKVPAADGLTDAVAALAAFSAAERHAILRTWADRLGRMLRLMHDRGVSHRDLKAPNILMRGAALDPLLAEPVLIDLVGATPGRQPIEHATRVRDLTRLAVSFLAHPLVTRTDRLRLLRSYMAWGLHGSADWKDWWTAVEKATRAKLAKNARSGRPLA